MVLYALQSFHIENEMRKKKKKKGIGGKGHESASRNVDLVSRVSSVHPYQSWVVIKELNVFPSRKV